MKPKSFVGSLFVIAVGFALSACVGNYVEFQANTGSRPVQTTGYLYRPSGDGPFPAVITLHGSGGLMNYHHSWAQWLRGEGYVAFVHSSPGRDIFGVAGYLKTLPFVQGGRIGVLGTSWGGVEAIMAGIDQRNLHDPPLKALVAIYPVCLMTYTGSSPLLLLVGGRDSWTPTLCLRMADEARAAGRPVRAILYPEAHHGFDNADLGARIVYVDSQWGGAATVAYDPVAHADAEKQIRAFFAEHLKKR